MNQLAEAGVISMEDLANGTLSDEAKAQITFLDADSQMKKALNAEYQSQVYQWGLTNPGKVDPETGQFIDDDAQAEYNGFFNSNVMGENSLTMENLIDGVVSDAALRCASDPESENNAAYNEILQSAPSFNNEGTWNTVGNNQQNFTQPIPAKGEFFVGPDGSLMKVTTDKAVNYKTGTGKEHEYFTAMNVDTGKIETIKPAGTDF